MRWLRGWIRDRGAYFLMCIGFASIWLVPLGSWRQSILTAGIGMLMVLIGLSISIKQGYITMQYPKRG